MPNKEKVIKGLEHCESHLSKACLDCPYSKYNSRCLEAIKADVLSLLREQEPVKPKEYMSRVNRTEYLCGACDSGILYGDKFCRHCGREAKWE